MHRAGIHDAGDYGVYMPSAATAVHWMTLIFDLAPEFFYDDQVRLDYRCKFVTEYDVAINQITRMFSGGGVEGAPYLVLRLACCAPVDCGVTLVRAPPVQYPGVGEWCA